MGAVLLMLLALVLPVAPAGAVGTVQDEGEATVQASHLTPFIFDDCNPSTNGQTRYFVTVVSSTGTNIPATNGGPGAATVVLIGAGTQNPNQTVQLVVGDLESQAFTGVDLVQAGGAPGRNGNCFDIGDIPAAQNDSHANDYGSPYVATGAIGTNITTWQMLISAPGHVSQLIDFTRFLVDGTPAPPPTFGGTGCILLDRGCLVSIGTITLQALTVPQAGRGSISGSVRDINGLPLVPGPVCFPVLASIINPIVAPAVVPTTALVTTTVPHGLVAGTVVTITGHTLTPLNGAFTATPVAANTAQFTIPVVGLAAGQVGSTGTGGQVCRLRIAAEGAGVEIVIFRQTDQDPTNDAGAPIGENQAFSVLADPLTGQYFVPNLWPGRYSVTVADTRFPTACALNANCGVQPATKIVNVFPGGFGTLPCAAGDANCNQSVTADFSVPVDLVAKQAPGQALSANLTGVFGYVVDGSTGGRIGSLTPGQAGFNPAGGSGGLATVVSITFAPVAQPAGCVAGVAPAPGGTTNTCVGTVSATTDLNGRYQAVLVAGQAYVATLGGGAPGANLGLLPLGFQGACTVGGNNPAAVFPGVLFPCGVGLEGQDRFTIGSNAANTPVPNAWNDGATFVLVPTTGTTVAPNGQTIVRRLEGVIPGIYRNPDTSYTGVDIETIQVRLMNNGVQRTGAQIEWYSTSSDDVASLVKTDTLDLNPGAVGIFTRSIIPDGCTRCMAQFYSIDLDAPNPFLGPGFLPTNTPAVPGINGFVYGLSDIQATVTHRVVDAGNAIAGSNGLTFEDIIPTGNTNNTGFVLPLVYKNYGGGVHKWNSVVSGCLTRGVPGPQPIVFEFLANGETRGGPYFITRSTNPGGCIVLNLNTFDPNDPDYFDPLASLPDGTFSVVVTSTAGTPIPTPPEVPGGFFTSALSYTTTGRMATLSNGGSALGNENCNQFGVACNATSVLGNNLRELYAPLIFKRYNDWNSGISVVSQRSRTPFGPFQGSGGGSGSGLSIAIYGEDGTLQGVYVDGASRSSGARIYYLPNLPIQIPDGFRGSSIIAIGDNTAGTRTGASVQTVNYERNQAMSYNFVTQDQVIGAQTLNGRPCAYPVNSTSDPNSPPIGPPAVASPLGGIPNPAAYVACLMVPDAERRFGGAPRGAAATFEVGLGPTTGVRLFNPDPFKNGAPAYTVASYLDSSGIVIVESYTVFSIPAYGTGTIFLGADARLPDIFDGSMFIQSTTPIAGIGNVVDYRITDRDASYSFNLPNQTGKTN